VFEECKQTASEIYTKLKAFKYSSYLDIGTAVQPLISKVKDQYRYHIIVKSSRKTDPSGKILIEALRNVKSIVKPSRDIRISYDIDTFNFM
jgi:primosomal protein N'